MAADTEHTLAVLDGGGTPQNLLTGQNVSDQQAYEVIVRTNGAMSSVANPQPTADATTTAAITALESVLATATNQGAEIGYLTEIANKLVSGTLSVLLLAGSAVIGAVGLTIGGVSGTIKAGGTPPAAADTALVVTQSPANAVAPVSTAALANSVLLKSGAGALYSVTVTTTSVIGWLMLFDAVSLPSPGPVTPVYVWPVQVTNGFASFSFPVPAKFLNGVLAAFSSTGPFTLTASATAFIAGQVV